VKLDVGCGLHKQQGSIGVDINRKDSQADVIASASHLPFRTGTFQEIICNRCIQWMPNQQQAIAEFHRVLTPDGYAYVSFHTLTALIYYYLTRFLYHGKYHYYGPHKKQQIKQLFTDWFVWNIYGQKRKGAKTKETIVKAMKHNVQT
jgi:ubiquinone/menaquinone biosynthesis C-methylase UbiE